MVSGHWINGSSNVSEGKNAGGHCCSDGHLVKQIKQWRQCARVIEDYEQVSGSTFDVVIKLRPDDLWYMFIQSDNVTGSYVSSHRRFGASLPYCALDLGTIFASKTGKGDMSDQWFSIPRPVLRPLLESIQEQLKVVCTPSSKFSTLEDRGNRGVFHFERSLYNVIESNQKRLGYRLSINFQPRILARPDPNSNEFRPSNRKNDVAEKCASFMPYVPRSFCEKVVFGDAGS